MMKISKYIGIALLVLAACTGKKSSDQSVEIVAQEKEIPGVLLTSEQITAIKIQTGHIEQRELKNIIKANGYLDVPPQNNAVVSPMITGYIRKINYLVGDNVNKGQVMAELESMEYIEMQQQYIELNAQVNFLKEEYDRQKLLRDNDAVSKKTYLKAEIDFKTAVSTFGGLKQKLRLLGSDFKSLEQGDIQSSFALRAPISGSVSKLSTMIGKHVDPSEEIFEIINAEHIHLELSVYEQDVPKVKKGQKVWFKIPGMEAEVFEGEVYLVGKDLSADKRSINVHVHIHGDESVFNIGMYANASIVIAEQPSNTLPVTAIVVDGTEKFVFKSRKEASGEFYFTKIPVITGMESDGLIELASMEGLLPGDDIVISGAFYLLNAFSVE